jgi:hypothetical protein
MNIILESLLPYLELAEGQQLFPEPSHLEANCWIASAVLAFHSAAGAGWKCNLNSTQITAATGDIAGL